MAVDGPIYGTHEPRLCFVANSMGLPSFEWGRVVYRYGGLLLGELMLAGNCKLLSDGSLEREHPFFVPQRLCVNLTLGENIVLDFLEHECSKGVYINETRNRMLRKSESSLSPKADHDWKSGKRKRTNWRSYPFVSRTRLLVSRNSRGIARKIAR